ncbi:unnamed protein product [Aureobasidium pullulans]|nr:unnamed protein product [Aureobasidium pullulans]
MAPPSSADKPALLQRQSSTLHYQTFPTSPPTSRGKPPTSPNPSSSNIHADAQSGSQEETHNETPLPKGQLAILAVIALAEQTALNSISPYLPAMASTFPEVKDGQVGLYVGLIASSFALAQFATNFFWGWLSDRIGRKPVVLMGTLLTAFCFVIFGFSEITDRSNQSRAFTYLPVVYGIGGITGPLVGGLLVFETIPWSGKPNPYPYLAPNVLSAGVLIIDLVLTMIFLEESLEEAKDLPPLKRRVSNLFAWLWQFTGNSTKPSYVRRRANHESSHANSRNDGTEEDTTDDESDAESTHLLGSGNHETLSRSDVFNRDTILLLITFLIFQLSNISYNSLYPIFAQAVPPTGRGLSPEEIGLSLGFAGLVTIVFQVGIFGKLREKVGNKTTYRVGLFGFVIAFLLMPWVGYKDGKNGSGSATTAGKVWLWVELGAVLIIKTVAAITNSAPNHSVLGTLNGLAQTLSAAGRAAGPFISGSLFTAATHVQPKGEALAFGIFGGISLLGFALSLGIRSSSLEAEGWDESDEDDDATSDEEEV